MRDLGLDILKRVAMGQSQPPPASHSQRLSGELRPPSGEAALSSYPEGAKKNLASLLYGDFM
jgi:hypothetical protein